MSRSSFSVEGIVIPMITPFEGNGDVDEAALRRYTDWLVRQGVHAVFTGSGCGEVWKLTTDQKKRMFEVVVETVAGRIPVLTGTAEGSTRATIALTQFSRDCGATAAVIWPPYFAGSGYADDTIVDHFRAIDEATAFPVVVYDAPEMCGYTLSPGLVARLAEIEAVVGLKDSSGQMGKFLQTLQATQGRIALYQGRDILLLPSLLMGAAGGFSSRANVAPRFVVELYNHARAGAWGEARAMHAGLQALCTSDLLGHDLWQVMKKGLQLQGIPVGEVCGPCFSRPFTEAARAELIARLEELHVKVV